MACQEGNQGPRRFFHDDGVLHEDPAGCFVLWQDHADALRRNGQLESDLLCAKTSMETLMLEVERLSLLLAARTPRVVEREE